MTNIFQLPYDARLQSWYDLRASIKQTDIKTKCVMIDKWWQYAPLVNRHLHILDSNTWPGPWDLLVENSYCTLARALGMCYTLLLLQINDIKLAEASDSLGDDCLLVLVDNAKYILNYHPDTVISNKINDFTVKRTIDINHLKQKI